MGGRSSQDQDENPRRGMNGPDSAPDGHLAPRLSCGRVVLRRSRDPLRRGTSSPSQGARVVQCIRSSACSAGRAAHPLVGCNEAATECVFRPPVSRRRRRIMRAGRTGSRCDPSGRASSAGPPSSRCIDRRLQIVRIALPLTAEYGEHAGFGIFLLSAACAVHVSRPRTHALPWLLVAAIVVGCVALWSALVTYGAWLPLQCC